MHKAHARIHTTNRIYCDVSAVVWRTQTCKYRPTTTWSAPSPARAAAARATARSACSKQAPACDTSRQPAASRPQPQLWQQPPPSQVSFYNTTVTHPRSWLSSLYICSPNVIRMARKQRRQQQLASLPQSSADVCRELPPDGGQPAAAASRQSDLRDACLLRADL